MASDFYAFDDDEPRSQGKDHLFLWTVFILLLVGIAFACWLGSFYVFGHPEQPRSYAILKKLKKIEPPKRFEVHQAPPGEFLTPQRLFTKYSGMQEKALEEENAELLRNYIKNYKESKKLVPYLTGRFEIIETHELKPTDLFSTGVVAVAAADEYSQVIIEHIFTTSPETVAAMKANLPAGLDMRLERSRDLAAIIHIARTDDGRMVFTAVPLLYGAWGVKGSIGSFSLQPPLDINLKAGAPIVRGDQFTRAIKTFIASRKGKPGSSDLAQNDATAKPPTQPELVRVDALEPGAPVPETGELPSMAVATPIPQATPRGQIAANSMSGFPAPQRGSAPVATPLPSATPFPRLAMNVPPATPLAVPTDPPGPPVAAVRPPPGVIKPFMQSSQIPSTTSEPGNWRTYSRGQQPPGRAISPTEASALADAGGEVSERLYLRGDFVVTASGGDRAVLRAPAAPGESARNGTGPARIIVEFPPSALPPAEGSTLTRDEAAGFEVRSVRRSQDGTINIYVRDITRG